MCVCFLTFQTAQNVGPDDGAVASGSQDPIQAMNEKLKMDFLQKLEFLKRLVEDTVAESPVLSEGIDIHVSIDVIYKNCMELVHGWSNWGLYNSDSFFLQYGHKMKSILIINEARAEPELQYDCLRFVSARRFDNLSKLTLWKISVDLSAYGKGVQTKIAKFFSKIKELRLVQCELPGFKAVTQRAHFQPEKLVLNKIEHLDQHYSKKYPTLKCLKLIGTASEQMIKMNPTLKQITVRMDVIPAKIQDAIEHAKALTDLTLGFGTIPTKLKALLSKPALDSISIYVNKRTSVNDYVAILQHIQKHKTVSKVFVKVWTEESDAVGREFNRGSFPKLETLYLTVAFPLNFILKLTALRELSLDFGDTISPADLPDHFRMIARFINELPKLKQLNVIVTETETIPVQFETELSEMCRRRADPKSSQLCVFLIRANQHQTFDLVRAHLYINTVVMYPVGTDWPINYVDLTEDKIDIERVYDRFRYVAECNDFVKINYRDFYLNYDCIFSDE